MTDQAPTKPKQPDATGPTRAIRTRTPYDDISSVILSEQARTGGTRDRVSSMDMQYHGTLR